MINPEMGENPIITKNSRSTFTPKTCCGCSMKYILSIPGLLRILNIILGFISLGLWLPGYEHQFLGERINQNTGETERGYGNGWKREPLNQFVLAAILLSLMTSLAILIGLIVIRNAIEDWSKLNKYFHLLLTLLLFMGMITACCGIWYFNENCCHVEMGVDMAGFTFSLAAKEGNYVRHCHCYLTTYLNLGNKFAPMMKETMLYDATKNLDMSQVNQRWTFSAHNLSEHVAGVVIIFLNCIVYLAASIVTKPKSKQKISMTS